MSAIFFKRFLIISVYLFFIFQFVLVFIAISGNTASPALKLTVIRKAHGQVIADRIAHSVRETQNISYYLSETSSTLSKTVAFNTSSLHRSVEQVGYRIK